ncbi:MAG: lysylphosphatidylglycerol synthase transmembrane domain-containing protein [Candidatus Omnitrophota bacterium]
MKSKLSILLRITVSLTFMGLLVWAFRKDIPDILGAIKGARPDYFLLAVLFNIAAIIIVSLRLKVILAVQGLRLTVMESVYLTFIGNFFNNFLPTSIGGDIVKAYYATKKSDRKVESFSAVFFDRFFGFLSIGLLAFLGLIFMYGRIEDPKLIWGCSIFAGAVLVIFVLFLNKSLAKAVFSGLLDRPFFRKGSLPRKLYNALDAYRAHPPVVAKVIGMSLFAQIVSVVSLFFIIRSLSQEVTFLNLLLITPLVSVASMMPSINGLGVREGAFVVFLSEFISKGSSMAVSILFLALVLLTGLIGGILYLFSSKLYKIPKVG